VRRLRGADRGDEEGSSRISAPPLLPTPLAAVSGRPDYDHAGGQLAQVTLRLLSGSCCLELRDDRDNGSGSVFLSTTISEDTDGIHTSIVPLGHQERTGHPALQGKGSAGMPKFRGPFHSRKGLIC